MKKFLVAIIVAGAVAHNVGAQSYYYAPGLTQASFIWVNFEGTMEADIATHPTAERVPGVIMADTQNSAFNPFTGNTWDWYDYPAWDSGFGYVGEMWVEGGKTYIFGKRFDDSARIIIDGEIIMLSWDEWNWESWTYSPAVSGWVEIDVRIYDRSGNKGPNREWAPDLGLAYNTIGQIDALPKENWKRLMDPGDGSLFRVKIVTDTATQPGFGVAPQISHAAGGDFNFSAMLAHGEGALSALAGFAGEYTVTNEIEAVATAGIPYAGLVEGLAADTAYHIVAFAENSFDETAMFPLGNVYTGCVAVDLTGAPFRDGEWMLPGDATVSRAATADATRLPLAVNYTVAEITSGGSITNHVFAGTVTIPANEASAKISLSNVLAGYDGLEIVTLAVSLAPGLYDDSAAQPAVLAVAPFPMLDSVSFTFFPDGTVFENAIVTARVDIAQTGVGSTLVFAWDDADQGDDISAWANTLTNFAPAAGANTFEIPGLALFDGRNWRVVLGAANVTDSLAGEFNVRYVYTWIGPNTASWNNAAHWDIGAVPNHPKADVSFPLDRTRYIDIAGAAGGAVTVGSISVDNEAWNSFNIVSSDDTPLVFGAAGIPAFMRARENSIHNIFISAPVEIAGETVFTQSINDNNGPYLFLLEKDVYGAGPLVVDYCARVIFAAPAGVTNVVEVPLASRPGSEQLSYFGVRGPGTVLLENHRDTVSLAAGWHVGLVAYGGTLVLSDTVLTNTCPDGIGSLFGSETHNQGNNTLVIEKGSVLFYPFHDDRERRMMTGDNTLLVTDPGSQLHITLAIRENRINNKILVRNGAYMANRERYWYPFTVQGSDHLIEVSSELPGQPAILEFIFQDRAKEIFLEGQNVTLGAKAGGIIDCGEAVLEIGKNNTLGNRVSIEGGEIFCGALKIHNGNFLTPVLTADGIKPIIAKDSVTFEAGAKIVVTNPGEVLGKFALVKAHEINIASSLNVLLDAPVKYLCTLSLEGEPGDQTLVLACFPPNTFIIVR